MTKHTILFLAANPAGTDPLSLDRQARAIQTELERSGHRDRFELVTRWAAEPLDLLRELRKLKPTVVHFSGQGSSGEPGLFFQGPDGRPQLVTTAAVQQTFGAAGSSVKLVVLSACFSELQAEALLAQVDCVVGMSGAITSHAARSFAVGFYGGLGERESVDSAFRQGCAAISLEAQVGGDQPQLKVRRGVNAARLVLAADGPASARTAHSAPPPATRPEDRPAGREHAASPGQLQETRPMRVVLLDRLSHLLPVQFEDVLFRANIPPEYLPGSSAPQAIRAMDVIRYFEQQGQLEQLARILRDVAGPWMGG